MYNMQLTSSLSSLFHLPSVSVCSLSFFQTKSNQSRDTFLSQNERSLISRHSKFILYFSFHFVLQGGKKGVELAGCADMVSLRSERITYQIDALFCPLNPGHGYHAHGSLFSAKVGQMTIPVIVKNASCSNGCSSCHPERSR
jgi:hypothetical protein